MRTLAENWQDFRLRLRPAGYTEQQLKFLKMTYYAGAIAMVDSVFSPATDIERTQALNALSEELRIFANTVEPSHNERHTEH